MGDRCRSPMNIDDASASYLRAVGAVRAAAGSRTKLSGATDRAGRVSRRRASFSCAAESRREGAIFPFVSLFARNTDRLRRIHSCSY